MTEYRNLENESKRQKLARAVTAELMPAWSKSASAWEVIELIVRSTYYWNTATEKWEFPFAEKHAIERRGGTQLDQETYLQKLVDGGIYERTEDGYKRTRKINLNANGT